MDASVLAGMQAMNTSINNAAQLAAAVGDSKAAQRMHEEDVATQWAMLEQQQRYAWDANQRAHDWSQDFMNQDYQHQKEFIEMQQAYNSPVNQMKLLREAGLNPALAFGQNGSQIGMASSGSHSSPSLVGSPSAGVPAQSGYFRAPNIADPAQSFAAVASAFQAIAQSKKTGVETGVLENTAADIARQISANADFSQIGAALAQEFGRPEREKNLRKTDEEIANLVASTANLAKTGAYTEALEAVAKVEKLIKENERLQGEEVLKVLPEQLRAVIENLRSQTGLNKASAENQHEQAVTEDRLREVRKNLFSSQQKEAENAAQELAEIARNYAIRNGMLPNEMNWREIQKMYLQQIREDLKSKEFENTWTGRFMHSLAGPAVSGSAAAAIKAGAMP